MHLVANNGLSVAGSDTKKNKVSVYVASTQPTRMFRRLGYPWELQVTKLKRESEQWRDLIFSDMDYEIIQSITLEQARKFLMGVEHTFDQASVEVDLRR